MPLRSAVLPKETPQTSSEPAIAPVESDLSLRKMRIAAVCVLGQVFATSLLALGALALIMLPMITEFGWTRSQFSYATSAILWCGAVTSPVLGRLTDRVGIRPVLLAGTAAVGVVTLVLSRQSTHLGSSTCVLPCWGFLVPAPLPTAKSSAHCLPNTGARRLPPLP